MTETITQTFTLDKVTKGAVRFAADDPADPVITVYVRKPKGELMGTKIRMLLEAIS